MNGPEPITPALEVDGISAGYGEGLILRNVSLRVAPSSVTALLGSNGAGKTTLMRTVAGLLRPAGGTIRLFGEEVTRRRPHTRFRSGMCLIPEGRGIFRGLSVRDNLVLQAQRGGEEAAIERVVSAFPVLGNRLEQLAGTMSGGEQQMLAVAAAYARDPRLVLVDEVSFGLAPLIVDEIFGFIEDIAASGSALLLVDQYAARVLAMADQAYVLHRGEISYAGPASELAGTVLFDRYLGT